LKTIDLISFEADIAEAFNRGEIRAPVHLAGGNEEQLIEIFEGVRPIDWVCCSWRSHYHCLLKGVPPERLKADIIAGRSITLTYPEYRIVSSAIVGGVLPIALGLAWSIARAGGDERVFVFAGDMTSLGGMYAECKRYAEGFNLPVFFVVEDNGISVCTDTKDTWGERTTVSKPEGVRAANGATMRYRYVLPWPHAGAGKRVQF
jgi:pyruvate dehydrogenase E1 component alpha subunit